jgi:hypothetical protein
MDPQQSGSGQQQPRQQPVYSLGNGGHYGMALLEPTLSGEAWSILHCRAHNCFLDLPANETCYRCKRSSTSSPHLHIGDCYGDGSADLLHRDSFQRKVSSPTQNYTKDYGQM